jgi:hypothetical protein
MIDYNLSYDSLKKFITIKKRVIFIGSLSSALIASILILPGKVQSQTDAVLSVGSKVHWTWLYQKLGQPTELVEPVKVITEKLRAFSDKHHRGYLGESKISELIITPIENTNLLKLRLLSLGHYDGKPDIEQAIKSLTNEHESKIREELRILDSEIKVIRESIKQHRLVIASLKDFLGSTKLDTGSGSAQQCRTILSVCDVREVMSRLETYEGRERAYLSELERASYVREKIQSDTTKLISISASSLFPFWRTVLRTFVLSFVAGGLLTVVGLIILGPRNNL